MKIVYDTMSGNTKSFVDRLPFNSCHISEYDGSSSFIMVTYTINFGDIPDSTKAFLDHFSENLKGVSSSGDKVWSQSYCKAADKISSLYNVPIISKFEKKGTKKDTEIFIEGVKEIWENGLD